MMCKYQWNFIVYLLLHLVLHSIKWSFSAKRASDFDLFIILNPFFYNHGQFGYSLFNLYYYRIKPFFVCIAKIGGIFNASEYKNNVKATVKIIIILTSVYLKILTKFTQDFTSFNSKLSFAPVQFSTFFSFHYVLIILNIIESISSSCTVFRYLCTL